jgi:hypothetical protein
MASYQDPRKAPKAEPRRVTDKPETQDRKPKRPAPKPAPKPIYTDWAMI